MLTYHRIRQFNGWALVTSQSNSNLKKSKMLKKNEAKSYSHNFCSHLYSEYFY